MGDNMWYFLGCEGSKKFMFRFIHSFLQQIFTEFRLYARHCFSCQRNDSEQYKVLALGIFHLLRENRITSKQITW